MSKNPTTDPQFEGIQKLANSLRTRATPIEEAYSLVVQAGELCKPPLTERDALRIMAEAYKPREEKKKRYAPTREGYYRLFEQVLGKLRRDIFSGKLMLQRDGRWESAWNSLELIRSEAYDLNEHADCKYIISAIEPHFLAYEHSLVPELLPEIPAWDGRDRLQEMAECLVLDGSQENFSSKTAEFYIKAWMAGIFRKLDDPRYQNPVLILRSARQGIGKDWFVNTLTDGLGQWAKNMNLCTQDRDNYLQLSNAAVLKIAEFDRTSKTDAATIKDMIFRDTTYLRGAYERDFVDRVCRASFVATVNPDDFFRDPTGNRRFAVFSLKSIIFKYERTPEASAQILAQARQLASDGFEVPRMHIFFMGQYLQFKTPEATEDITCHRFDYEVSDWLAFAPLEDNRKAAAKRGWISNEELVTSGILDRISKALGVPLRSVRCHLKTRGRGIRGRVEGELCRGFSFEILAESCPNVEKSLAESWP